MSGRLSSIRIKRVIKVMKNLSITEHGVAKGRARAVLLTHQTRT